MNNKITVTEKTKVKFLLETQHSLRKGHYNTVMAFFPELPHSNDDMTSYSHNEQHTPCNVRYANALKPATSLEYAQLATELTIIGYDLEILN